MRWSRCRPSGSSTSAAVTWTHWSRYRSRSPWTCQRIRFLQPEVLVGFFTICRHGVDGRVWAQASGDVEDTVADSAGFHAVDLVEHVLGDVHGTVDVASRGEDESESCVAVQATAGGGGRGAYRFLGVALRALQVTEPVKGLGDLGFDKARLDVRDLIVTVPVVELGGGFSDRRRCGCQA